MTTPYNKNYPINAWITSLVIASVLICLVFPIVYKDEYEGNDPLWKLLIFSLFIGTMFSSPIFMITYLLYRKLLNKGVSIRKIKIIIFVCTTALMILMFVILGFGFFDVNDGWLILLFYLLANSISIFLTPLQPKTTKP